MVEGKGDVGFLLSKSQPRVQDDQQVSNYHSRLKGDDDEELENDVEIPNGSSTNKM